MLLSKKFLTAVGVSFVGGKHFYIITIVSIMFKLLPFRTATPLPIYRNVPITEVRKEIEELSGILTKVGDERY